MKKTVSINIGSIIFHIEEDGYDRLKNYLDSINKYFSSFEDSSEIIADIESRIAEIFLSKLANGRQTVNIEDVEELISTMGTTKDFQATIESDDENDRPGEPGSSAKEATAQESTENDSQKSKRICRDTKRRILGGVAAGIAHYYSIDPLWIRLLFVALLINFLNFHTSLVVFGAYIVLWVVLPPNAELEEDKRVKKLYRNPDSRVLGGIAGGIAAYFGSNAGVIRLLFVLSAFLSFGVTIFAYFILWIITPEARTITEKMQMQGEPVTISNIKENVKKSLNVKEGEEENPLVKILLFPFRLIALVINGLGKILGPAMRFISELIRIAFGIILASIGLSLMFGWTICLFIVLGIGQWDILSELDFIPLDLIQHSITTWPVIFVYIVCFVPALAFTLLGLGIILKRFVINAYVGWSLFALWIISLFGASFMIPRIVSNFAAEEDIRREESFAVTPATPTLRLNDLTSESAVKISFESVDLRVRGHEDSTYQLIMNIESHGKNRADAKTNAEAVIYQVKQQGDDFYFDSNISLPEGEHYRFQNLDATFYIPYGKEFKMDYELKNILINTLHINGYSALDIQDKNTWVFQEDGLHCVTCQEDHSALPDGEHEQDEQQDDSDFLSYPFEGFSEVTISALFDIEIDQGDDWQVTVRGDEDLLDEVYINQVGNRLEVIFKKGDWEWWKDHHPERPKVSITMPELEFLEIRGDCHGEVTGFTNDKMHVEVTGASRLYLNAEVNDLQLELNGASKTDLRGSANQLSVELNGATELEGYDFHADRASIKALGASKAEIYADDELDIDAAGVSKVTYRGTNRVDIKSTGVSSVSRD